MQVKDKKNPDLIYKIIWIMDEWKDYFSRDEKLRKSSRERLDQLKDRIKNPEISKDGLDLRISANQDLMFTFFFTGLYITHGSILIIGVILRLPIEVYCAFAAFGFYFSSTAFVLSFRTWFAELDLKKYKKRVKKGTTDGFEINRKAEPKMYDLIPGILGMVLIFWYFMFMNSIGM